MISLGSIDTSEKPSRVSVTIGDNEKNVVDAYLYGHSDLIQHNYYKMESNCYEESLDDISCNIFELNITYVNLSGQFKFNEDTMTEICIIYPKTKVVIYYNVNSYNVNFVNGETSILYEGVAQYQIKENNETFSLWAMIGFENVTKDMLETFLFGE